MTDPNDPAGHAHVVDMHALHEATEAAKAAGVTDIQAVMPADPTVSVPGPDTPTWTIDDDDSLTEQVAETIRTTFGHPPITDTPGAVIGERWIRAARAVLSIDAVHQRCQTKLDTRGADLGRFTQSTVAHIKRLERERNDAIEAARAHERCGPAGDTLRDQLAKSQARQEFYGKDAGHWKRKYDQATDTIQRARELAENVDETAVSRDWVLGTYGAAQTFFTLGELLDLLVDGGGDG